MKPKTIPNIISFDKIADSISLDPSFYQNIVRIIGPLSSSEKILDVGCGNGNLLEMINRASPRVQLVGLDFSPGLLKNARIRLKNKARLVNGDALALPFSNNEFDVVILSEVLEHLSNPSKGLAEAKRVLKKNGRFLLTFPNASSYWPFYPWVKNLPQGKLRFIFTPPEAPEKTRQPQDCCLYFRKVIKLLKKVGFRIKIIQGTTFFHYLGEIPLISSFIIFAWRKTPFDKILNKLIGPRWAYRVFVEAAK